MFILCQTPVFSKSVKRLVVTVRSLFCNSFLMFLQRTIRSQAKVQGIGLHTGEKCSLTFKPAPGDVGIHFIRRDLPGSPAIKVFVDHVRATSNATTLGNEHFSVSTVEHCLSALAAFRIDNLFIELEGPEIPICDGSSFAFTESILKAGFVELEQARNYIYIKEPIYIDEGEKQAYVLPYDGLRITCTIDFPHPSIGKQHIDIDINDASFEREIAKARTFGFIKDVESLKQKGLARGASLENAIGLSEDGIVNQDGLRFPDEFVRHKVLDALGDLVTLGSPLMGHLVIYKAGHDILNKLVRQILKRPDNFTKFEMGEKSTLYSENYPFY